MKTEEKLENGGKIVTRELADGSVWSVNEYDKDGKRVFHSDSYGRREYFGCPTESEGKLLTEQVKALLDFYKAYKTYGGQVCGTVDSHGFLVINKTPEQTIKAFERCQELGL